MKAKEKRELGYKLDEAISKLEEQIQSIKLPEVSMLSDMMSTITEKKQALASKLETIRDDVKLKGIDIKPRPKRGRPKKKK